MGVRASDGKLLWKYDLPKTTAVIPTPIVKGDLVFYAIGYDKGAGLLKQVPTATGEVEIKELYSNQERTTNKTRRSCPSRRLRFW